MKATKVGPKATVDRNSVLFISHITFRDCCIHIFATFLKIGSFSNDDGEGNENGKKTIDLMSKTTTLHVHHTFLYISLPSLHDYDVKMPNFTFYGERKQGMRNFSFSF